MSLLYILEISRDLPLGIRVTYIKHHKQENTRRRNISLTIAIQQAWQNS